MSEAAAAPAPAAATSAPAAAAPSTTTATTAPVTASATLTSVPTGPDWASSFKNEELKNYVQEKKFTSIEQMAERYQNLEKLKGVPEDRLLRLPEKMEGDEARAVWEKLGTPKEAAGYELPKEGTDPQFTEWAQGAFHKNNLTKAQAQGVVGAFNEFMKSNIQAKAEGQKNAIAQADASLQKEWGQHYDTNLNLAKQGARILGLDGKTLDMIESVQGRENLFKTLQKIGVSVGESSFVDGKSATITKTPEQAMEEIKQLMNDKKFAKAVGRGDVEATNRWNELNKLAAPGEKPLR